MAAGDLVCRGAAPARFCLSRHSGASEIDAGSGKEYGSRTQGQKAEEVDCRGPITAVFSTSMPGGGISVGPRASSQSGQDGTSFAATLDDG